MEQDNLISHMNFVKILNWKIIFTFGKVESTAEISVMDTAT